MLPSPPRLLCTDLDRTLLPNGAAAEDPGAREALAGAIRRGGLILAYVSGRGLDEVREAMSSWDLPEPDYALCDVGSSMYRRSGRDFQPVASWEDRLATEWPEDPRDALPTLAADGLRPQGTDHQSRFKLSFYGPVCFDDAAQQSLREKARRLGLLAKVVHSVDETRDLGLVDLLPESSGKLRAIEHLMGETGVGEEVTLFAGDSGNDLEVLASAIPAVLVANATDAVRDAANRAARRNGTGSRLHLARGAGGRNGNYASGILEGLVHFWPGAKEWLR